MIKARLRHLLTAAAAAHLGRFGAVADVGQPQGVFGAGQMPMMS